MSAPPGSRRARRAKRDPQGPGPGDPARRRSCSSSSRRVSLAPPSSASSPSRTPWPRSWASPSTSGCSPVLTRAVARDPGAIAEQWAAGDDPEAPLAGPDRAVYLAVPLVMHRPWDTTAAVWLLGLAIALQAFIELAVSVFTAVQRLEQELRCASSRRACCDGRASPRSGSAAASSGSRRRSSSPRPSRSSSPSGASTAGSPRSTGGGAPAGARTLARELAPVAQAHS